MAWTGFTEEQLKFVKTRGEGLEDDERQARRSGHNPRRGRERPGPSRGSRTRPQQMAQPREAIEQDQMLSRPRQAGLGGKAASPAERSVWSELKEPTQRRPPPARRRPPAAPRDDVEKQQGPGSVPEAAAGGKAEEATDQQRIERDEKEKAKENEEMKVLNENEGQERELSKLEEFQRKQKLMEEENAKKKSLLARAIADRKKRTQAEAKRLAYIQRELATIENLLSSDVSILRDKIEMASRDYNDAQRRYQKAETEFVAAKIGLHKAAEMKEALTEHLCTIIHENEIRKAKKLAELVSKLEVENLQDFENLPDEAVKPPTTPTSPVQGPSQVGLLLNHSENAVTQQETLELSEKRADSETTVVEEGVSPEPDEQSQIAVASAAEIDHEKQVGQDEGETTSNEKRAPKNEGRTNSTEKVDCSPSNDQPEAEQHVEFGPNQS